ncbi:MAG: DUF1800 family protein [Hyphomicrobiales bacterium]|nr:DUF1800 family protein [Hyphomicrobiales bacterium]MDE2016786.1 DUF1800 family protein [Hyphomicrobiales bacterium]
MTSTQAPDPVLVALNRFGLGGRPGDYAAIAADPRGALLAELATPDVATIRDPALPTSAEAIQKVYERNKLERELKLKKPAAPAPMAAKPDAMAAKPAPPDRPAAPKLPQPQQEIFLAEVLARIHKALDAGPGFVERLVAFWSNHFAVATNKDLIDRATAGAFEREAIRPFVLGRFVDMLQAVERHPAMLTFLDNRVSIGPDSPAGLRQHRGLNENLARETMELHTLGVRSGYTQADVTNYAKIITGWTIVGPPGKMGEPGSFAFNRFAHEPGAETVLHKVYAQAGVGQGEAVLRDLAAHPATARHVAFKLARHFVADAPPPALVERLAKAYLESHGDLAVVSKALLAAPEAWSAPATKMRDPWEFVVAALRATKERPDKPQPVLGAMNLLGMPIWTPAGPNGFSDVSAAWDGPEAMKLRLDLAARFAFARKDHEDPRALLTDVLGPKVGEATRVAVARAASQPQGVALMLMSPEFQRR